MSDFFSGWNIGSIIALISIVGGLLTIVLSVFAVCWCMVRRAEIAAELKRDMLARGLSVEQVERLVIGPPPPALAADGRELEGQLASVLVQNEIDASLMDEVLSLYQAADTATKSAVYDSLVEIIESGADEDQVLSAVRAICRPPTAVATSPSGVGMLT